MGTKLALINLAFAHLTEPTVLDLSGDPPSPNVQKALAQYDAALDDVLTLAPWLCALEAISLPVMTAPAGGWGDWRLPYRHALPREALRLWHVEEGEYFGWQRGVMIGAGGAKTDVIKSSRDAPLNVELIVRRPADALTPLLFTAVSYELAARLAGPIQSDANKARAMRDQAQAMVTRAEGVETSEIGPQGDMLGQAGGPLAEARRIALGT